MWIGYNGKYNINILFYDKIKNMHSLLRVWKGRMLTLNDNILIKKILVLF